MTEEQKDYYCDFLCKFRDKVFSETKDCDEAEKRLLEEYCENCILNEDK